MWPNQSLQPTPVGRLSSAFVLATLCLFCAGCVHFSTTAERGASFSPHNDAKVGETSLREYLIVRSAFLVNGERVDTTSIDEHSFDVASTSPASYGMAAAIDKRGYFLTAAHCVEKAQVWLAFLRDGKIQMERARIVWRGDKKKREPDLAIICVSHPIGQTFQWAAEFTNGSPVVDVGLRMDIHSHSAQPQCMAGKLLEVSEALSADSLDYSVVSHSSPFRPGDSGGPLVLSDGRLLGINVSETLDFHWSHLSFKPEHCEAHRPDLIWLRKVIDADAALQSTSWPNTALEPTADSALCLSGSVGFATRRFGGGSAGR